MAFYSTYNELHLSSATSKEVVSWVILDKTRNLRTPGCLIQTSGAVHHLTGNSFLVRVIIHLGKGWNVVSTFQERGLEGAASRISFKNTVAPDAIPLLESGTRSKRADGLALLKPFCSQKVCFVKTITFSQRPVAVEGKLYLRLVKDQETTERATEFSIKLSE